MDDRELGNRLNQIEDSIGKLQGEIKRLDSRIDSTTDWATKAKLEHDKQLRELDTQVTKLSKDVVAMQKKK